MSDNEKELKDAAEFLIESMEKMGVSASTVQDGHLLMFKRSYLENLLAKYPTNKEFTIFLQRPDFKN